MKHLTFLLLLTMTVGAQDVLQRKVDKAELIMFSPNKPEHRGKINVGSTITIAYLLRVTPRSRARFVAIDATKSGAVQSVVNEGAHVPEDGWSGGYLIRSTTQPRLDVHISRRLLDKVGGGRPQDRMRRIEDTLSREANLSVTLKRKPGKPVQIERVNVN